MKIEAKVIKGVGGDFVVLSNSKIYVTKARKKLKLNRVKVGDSVEFNEKELVIEKVLPRKNELVRPPVANIDMALIVVAPVPKPDFLLIDKLLIKFFSLNIDVILVINKMDLATNDFVNDIKSQYEKVCEIVLVTAINQKQTNLTLMPLLKGRVVVLTGQSAVGKSSILNALLPNLNKEVGALSLKAERGKNTTRHSEIYLLDNGAMLADTPGFNAFELENFTPEDIIDNYKEFWEYSVGCKYNDCNHINEDEKICAVKQALNDKLINASRYERFKQIYQTIREKVDKKYE